MTVIFASGDNIWGNQRLDTGSKSPSFKGLEPASEAASRAKRANRRRDSNAELLLRKELWRLGLRYRKNVETLPGKPDIAFSGAKVAIFCDGDFWHGRDWSSRRGKLEHGANASYWLAKISSNIERDDLITNRLVQMGWRVLRLWETNIKRDPRTAAVSVRDFLLRSNVTSESWPPPNRAAEESEHEIH